MAGTLAIILHSEVEAPTLEQVDRKRPDSGQSCGDAALAQGCLTLDVYCVRNKPLSFNNKLICCSVLESSLKHAVRLNPNLPP